MFALVFFFFVQCRKFCLPENSKSETRIKQKSLLIVTNKELFQTFTVYSDLNRYIFACTIIMSDSLPLSVHNNLLCKQPAK